MTEDSRRIIWEGCWNTRHLGGYKTEDGQMTYHGALIRSGNMARLTSNGKTAVIASGVSYILDLRSAFELDIEANPFAAYDATEPMYLHLPLMDEDNLEAIRLVNTATSTLYMYQLMLEHFKPNIARIIRSIAEAPPGAVVVHCHAGKDRTGLVIALVLRLVGVSLADIAEDYALSDVYLQDQYQEMLQRELDTEKRALLATQLTSRPETMLEMFEHIDRHYGSLELYLENCGVDVGTLQRIKKRLINPTI
jgi:protein-tyrosine phosphatase